MGGCIGLIGNPPVFLLPFLRRYRYSGFAGLAITAILVSSGALLTWNRNPCNHSDWFGRRYSEVNAWLVSLDEDPVEKNNSFKAAVTVLGLQKDSLFQKTSGRAIIYFSKEGWNDQEKKPAYGTQLIFCKPLQSISHATNPGGFDFWRHALFRGITHQVYLRADEYYVLPGKKTKIPGDLVNGARKKVLGILRTNISGETERGLAEALLIGYKNDLDPDLLRSYSNTGVVHIIAISGLHLGIVYGLLSLLAVPLKRFRNAGMARVLFMIIGLWTFTFLTGSQPSVLRSALMFSFIVISTSSGRKNSMLNAMAASAFLILCINPFSLWDAGFQLSYAAVLSIVIFMRPIYNLIYVKNKLLDLAWKMTAVTISAQVLTIPISIYHFHQFPVYFLLSNFLAVPLSSLIVITEIFLCAVSVFPFLALLLGKAIAGMITLMNTWVLHTGMLPGSQWGSLQVSAFQAVLLYIFIAGLSAWLLYKTIPGLQYSLFFLMAFMVLRCISFLECERQKRIIVYNVPRQTAIDFVNGRTAFFLGRGSPFIESTRTLYRVSWVSHPEAGKKTGPYLSFRGKRIMIMEEEKTFHPKTGRIRIDLLVVSGNKKAEIKKICSSLDIKQVVFDPSVGARKTNKLKKDCDSLHIPWHDVSTGGAFVMNLR